MEPVFNDMNSLKIYMESINAEVNSSDSLIKISNKLEDDEILNLFTVKE